MSINDDKTCAVTVRLKIMIFFFYPQSVADLEIIQGGGNTNFLILNLVVYSNRL